MAAFNVGCTVNCQMTGGSPLDSMGHVIGIPCPILEEGKASLLNLKCFLTGFLINFDLRT